MRIGVARGLLYFWYGSAWERFLDYCGISYITSPSTDHTLLTLGVKTAQDEICLPVKVFLGHILHLVRNEKVDAVLVPHLIQVEPRRYICPKFMGLPDMVRTLLPKGFPIYIWESRGRSGLWSLDSVPREWIKRFPGAVLRGGLEAAKKAFEDQWRDLARMPEANSKRTLGIIAHPYCLHDGAINLHLLERLQSNGYQVLIPEMVPDVWLKRRSRFLNKPLFWTLGERNLGAAEFYLERDVEGVIFLTAFACGPESMVGELVERVFKENGKPMLKINLDEHTGEAGMVTRLEAFLDLLARRRRVAGYFSPDGSHIDFARHDPSGTGN